MEYESGDRTGRNSQRASAALLCVTAAVFAAPAFPQAFAQAALPPQVIHFCDAECNVLYLTTDRLAYSDRRNVPSPPRDSPGGIWINRFDATGIELVRHDPPTPIFPEGLRGTVTGRIAPDGNHAIDGKTTWTFGMALAYEAQIAWGPLLDSLPTAGQAPGAGGVQARQRIQAALSSPRVAATEAAPDAASDDGAVFGEFDLRAYQLDLARASLDIARVRRAEYHERIGDRDVAHTVLIVDSYCDDESAGETTGVRDYLTHKPGNRSTQYGPEDIVNRDIVASNGVKIYGGIDRQNVFQLNVELRPDARGRAGLDGRDVWRPTLDELTRMTASLTSDRAASRAIVRESINRNAPNYPDEALLPDLGPGRRYFGALEMASLVPAGPAGARDEGERILQQLQDAFDRLKEDTGDNEPPGTDGGTIQPTTPRYIVPEGDGTLRKKEPRYLIPEGDGVIRPRNSGSRSGPPPQ
jgi:hypothetical protein